MPATSSFAKRILRCGLALLALASSLPAAAQATEWATGPLQSTEFPDYFEMRAAARDASGNAYYIGWCFVMGRSGACIQRVDGATGDIAWSRFLQWGTQDGGRADIAVDASGNVIAVQQCTSAGEWGYCLAKLSGATGDSVWYATLTETDIQLGAPHIAVDAGGNAILAAVCANELGSSTYNPCVAKFGASNGAVAWTRHLDWDMQVLDSVAGLAVDGSGNAVVAGTCRIGAMASGYFSNICVAKLAAADGSTAWQAEFNGPSHLSPSDDKANGLALAANGDALVAGTCEGDACVIRFASATGTTPWSRILASETQAALKVRADAGGHVLVLSRCTYEATSSDICIERLNGSTGATLWNASHSSPGAFVDTPGDLVVDGSGTAFVTGTCGAAVPPTSLICTFKLDVATGGKPWVAYHSPTAETGPNPNHGAAVVLDASGNPVSLGSCVDSGPRWSCGVKHAASNGAESWSFVGYVFLPADTRYRPPGTAPVAPTGRHGGFVYTASHCGPDSGLGMCLRKVNENTGAVAWSVPHDAFTAPAPTLPSGIAFAPNGDPIVAATCRGAAGSCAPSASRPPAAP